MASEAIKLSCLPFVIAWFIQSQTYGISHFQYSCLALGVAQLVNETKRTKDAVKKLETEIA